MGSTWFDLEHQWDFDISPGQTIELHVESEISFPFESFRVDYSEDGGENWTFTGNVSPFAFDDKDRDQIIPLPNTLNGPVIIRLTDNFSYPAGDEVQNELKIDEMWVRVFD